MQSLVFFYGGRGWENQRVSSPKAVKGCLQGAREVEQVSAELGSDKGVSEAQPPSACCIMLSIERVSFPKHGAQQSH